MYFSRHAAAAAGGWTPTQLQRHLQQLVKSTGMSLVEAEEAFYRHLGGTVWARYFTPDHLRKALAEPEAFPTRQLVQAVLDISAALEADPRRLGIYGGYLHRPAWEAG